MKKNRSSAVVIDGKISSGCEFGGGCKGVFSWIMGDGEAKLEKSNILKVAWVGTPLGLMIAIADENVLYLLEFVDSRGLERKVVRLRNRTESAFIRCLYPRV